ncbi:MAG: hypothetical protein ACRDSK_20350 [Actinophytocola sp.]|uniref:hypothetical protein n=1 Tax=Actinophytocola sp. TaxID=1872138 RepID=UPI003D6C18E0
MLYLVLGLVLAAFGLLIAALTTANTLFAWASVAVSVVAAGLLVLDWVRGRRRVAEDTPAGESEAVPARSEPPFGDETPPLSESVPAGPTRSEAAFPAVSEPASEPDWADDEPIPAVLAERTPDAPAEEPADSPAERRAARAANRPTERRAERPSEPPEKLAAQEAGEPGEEQTDAADLLVVSDLRDEVRVVDEHPRYHLASCTYLRDKPTLPLPVAEARQLGFTPCARCGPDATLAARHRATR